MVHVEVDETQKSGTQLQKILKDVMIDFATTEMIWQKNLRRSSTIRRSHQRHEQDLKSLTMLKMYWPLQDQTQLYTYVRCDVCELSFVWCFFRQPQIKSAFSKLLFVLCVSLSISLISPQTLDPIEDEWRWSCIFWTDESIGDGPMDSEHGGSHEE